MVLWSFHKKDVFALAGPSAWAGQSSNLVGGGDAIRPTEKSPGSEEPGDKSRYTENYSSLAKCLMVRTIWLV